MRGDDADGVLDGVVAAVARPVGDGAPVGAFAFLGEPLEGIGRVHDLAPGLDEGLALFEGEGAGQFVGAVAEVVGGLLEDLGPFVDGKGSPGGHGAGRGVDRAVGVGGGAVGDFAERGFIGRVDHGERAAVLGVAPLAIDEHAGAGGGRVWGGSRHESSSLLKVSRLVLSALGGDEAHDTRSEGAGSTARGDEGFPDE